MLEDAWQVSCRIGQRVVFETPAFPPRNPPLSVLLIDVMSCKRMTESLQMLGFQDISRGIMYANVSEHDGHYFFS